LSGSGQAGCPRRNGGERIENLRGLVRPAEVAGKFAVGGYAQKRVGCLRVLESFVAEVEERFVPPVVDLGDPDRSAEGGPELVLVKRRDRGLERIARVEIRISHILPRGPMEFVGAGFGLHLDHGTSGLRKLRVVITGGDLHFTDRVDIRVHHDDAQHGIVVVRAVDHEIGGPEALPVVVDLNAGLRIFARSVLPEHLLRTGHHQLKRGKVAVQNREIANLFG